MWRFLAGVGSALALMAAGILLFGSASAEDPVLPPPPPAEAIAVSEARDDLPERVPEASARTREEKRFDRYDKDRDSRITRDEMLATRRKAYAKLDSNGDGRLSFEEWAIRTSDKFAKADADNSGILTRAEFATTKVQRKTPSRVNCPPAGDDDD
ncbi:histidine kinase [Sphingomonas japonica]|uniref:EF-hand domain-containing protein n=1 Tax=Sphingomonas japonica TaxID=511662 RepID=A0ABX0U3E3_9SPHN|nr:histidine kinase [Sphingomonas japonica]NIJ24565.1 hypothetical protein [Sphingomonas japonica]